MNPYRKQWTTVVERPPVAVTTASSVSLTTTQLQVIEGSDMRTAAKITRELHDIQRKMMIANSPRLLAALKHRAKALSTELALTVGTLSLGAL
jgi:hypothetical protein